VQELCPEELSKTMRIPGEPAFRAGFEPLKYEDCLTVSSRGIEYLGYIIIAGDAH
jgi:hypothetical protein